MPPVNNTTSNHQPNTANDTTSETVDTISNRFNSWFEDVNSQPTKIILLTSVAFHFLLFFCLICLCYKYRRLQSKFKIIKQVKNELDVTKRETTKLNNFYNNSNNNCGGTRPGTNTTSGIYFDECLADQKLLSNPPHAQKRRHHSSSSALQPGTTPISLQNVDASMPPTPLPRSKSKPEFQNMVNNNNNKNSETDKSDDPVTDPTDITSGVFSETQNNSAQKQSTSSATGANESGAWFIPITPATTRASKGNSTGGGSHPKVQHTPHQPHTKRRHESGDNIFEENTERTQRKLVYGSDGAVTNSPTSSTNSPGKMNPLAALSLWEQHENRPVLKHAK